MQSSEKCDLQFNPYFTSIKPQRIRNILCETNEATDIYCFYSPEKNQTKILKSFSVLNYTQSFEGEVGVFFTFIHL